LSVHNSHMYIDLMAQIRRHIARGTFAEFRKIYAATYVPSQKILDARLKQALKLEDRG